MAQLGVFYALSDEQVDAIAEQDDDKMYAYMLNTIEENLLGTPKSYQIDKAWEGIHYCLCAVSYTHLTLPTKLEV